jgi:hypothetical protein
MNTDDYKKVLIHQTEAQYVDFVKQNNLATYSRKDFADMMLKEIMKNPTIPFYNRQVIQDTYKEWAEYGIRIERILNNNLYNQ